MIRPQLDGVAAADNVGYRRATYGTLPVQDVAGAGKPQKPARRETIGIGRTGVVGHSLLDNGAMHAEMEAVSQQEPPALRVRGLSAAYGPLAALRDVDLDVGAGDIVGIAGDNGAGKSTLLRCIHGDVAATHGQLWLAGAPLPARRTPGSTGGIGIVWQHLMLSDNLDVAANLLLGTERRRLLSPPSHAHTRARRILDDLHIPISDTTRIVRELPVDQRQLLAIAQATWRRPPLLLLDEPTAVLSRADSAHIERLIQRFHAEGTTMLLVSHDIEQLFRMATRIVVLRRGQVVAQLDPAQSYPDEVLALMAGHDLSSVPRRQLTRLHGLTDQLAATDASSGLALVLSTLATALGDQRVGLHVLDGPVLHRVGSVRLPVAVEQQWQTVSLANGSGPIFRAAQQQVPVVEPDVGASQDLSAQAGLLAREGIVSWWAVPFTGAQGLRGVVSVFGQSVGSPARDELDLVKLYADYAATTLERERLVSELTARNKVLETIRAVLQTLAGPDSLTDGLTVIMSTLRDALGANEIGLFEKVAEQGPACRAFAAAEATEPSAQLALTAASALRGLDERAPGVLLTRLSDRAVLVARWPDVTTSPESRVLLEDAAHSILLALERQRAEVARRESAALRRSQQLQQQFLARLSHELRTPLTAIRGYASSLMQTDVTWDDESKRRFLTRIGSESARLRRLVDDLLDFSMIESGMLRVRPDWVDLPLVIDAARSCLSPQAASRVQIDCDGDIPAIWADHDRLEQMMMNLMDNAIRHNPGDTRVQVHVRRDGPLQVQIDVVDDGAGMPAAIGPSQSPAHATAGAGLGLSITRGIVQAHHGSIRHRPAHPGTCFTIRLPVEEQNAAPEVDHA